MTNPKLTKGENQTTALPTGANPLTSQRAAAIWAGIENLVPRFATTITMTA